VSARRRRPTLKVDIRDQRLPGGRFTCSARTTSAPEFRRREAAVRALIEAGAYDILARITTPGPRRLHLSDVVIAVAAGDIGSLRISCGPSLLMLGQSIDRLKQRKEATRAAGTATKVSGVAKHIESFFGVVRTRAGTIIEDVDITTITTRQCEEFLTVPRDGAPWAPRTQVVAHAYAMQVWAIAIGDEMEAAERENRRARMRTNPWAKIDPARVVPTRVIFLTEPERDAMLARLAGTPMRAFMAVGYLAGLRIGEAIHLRTDIDVDLPAGQLRVQSRPGEYAWTTKTKRNRDVPMSASLRAILMEHVRLGFAGDRYFFRAPGRDRPLGSTTAWHWWVAAYDAAGIKHGRAEIDAVVYHTGRHSFASLLVQAGVSPMIVAELMGIRFEEVIATYGHLAPHNLADAVAKLESRPVSNESSTNGS